MKKEKSRLEEIRQSINDYVQRMSEINTAITDVNEKHSVLEDQIKNYTDLDNESGYLQLKQELRAIEDRLEFLQIKKNALKVSDSVLEADRAIFRDEQGKILSDIRNKVDIKISELMDIMANLRADFNELDALLDLWSATYGQPPNIQRGFLADNTGILIAVDDFNRQITAIKNYKK